MVQWRERLAPDTFRTYYGFLVGFCKEVQKDPEELTHWAKSSAYKYDVLDALQKFIIGLNGRRYATKHIAYAAIRSFLMRNRANLPRDPSSEYDPKRHQWNAISQFKTFTN